MLKMNKFKIGDYVEVIAQDGDSLPVGSRGTIVEMDDDFGGWMYGLDSDEETFYNESMLKLVEKEPERVDPSPPDSGVVLQYKVTYFIDQNRMVLTGPDGAVIIDDNKKDVHAQNTFLSGFFEGLCYMKVQFKVTAEYVRG
jgi:hypothetical protein